METKTTVANLIARLEEIADKGKTVNLEGCDCIGQWEGSITENPDSICLNRD